MEKVGLRTSVYMKKTHKGTYMHTYIHTYLNCKSNHSDPVIEGAAKSSFDRAKLVYSDNNSLKKEIKKSSNTRFRVKMMFQK